MAATQCNKTDGVDKSSCKASNIRKKDIFFASSPNSLFSHAIGWELLLSTLSGEGTLLKKSGGRCSTRLIPPSAFLKWARLCSTNPIPPPHPMVVAAKSPARASRLKSS
jgi:hypothetical protein